MGDVHIHGLVSREHLFGKEACFLDFPGKEHHQEAGTSEWPGVQMQASSLTHLFQSVCWTPDLEQLGLAIKKLDLKRAQLGQGALLMPFDT